MTDRQDDSDGPVVLEAPEVNWVVTCQVCGAAQRPGGSILCEACGEPVLVWGWAP